MSTSANWQTEQDRAMSIFYALQRARLWCICNPGWDMSINMNGALDRCVVVKVWYQGEVLKTFNDNDRKLNEILGDATLLMGATREWYRLQAEGDADLAGTRTSNMKPVRWQDYARCPRCNVMPMKPCQRVTQNVGELKTHPHPERPRFRMSNG